MAESVPIENVQEALAYMQRFVDGVEAERNRYKDALTRIANQGLGTWDPQYQGIVGATGLPWLPWASIAEEALTGKGT